MIKASILSLVGQRNAGRLDYLLNRKSKDAWGPLNGQRNRQQVYSEIMKQIRFQAIVETGTFLGTTTEYFAQCGLPVYTVEIHPRAYGYASLRFRKRRHQIHAYEGDSPNFLNDLVRNPDFPKSNVFFYLDAHVQDSSRFHKAPLVEELEIIFTNWTGAVVMIDDFQVPGTDYGFDDWGPDKSLNLARFEPIKNLNLNSFFPTLDVKEETGARRGWVVLCREKEVASILENMPALMPRMTMSIA
jgi:hypothetical protein